MNNETRTSECEKDVYEIKSSLKIFREDKIVIPDFSKGLVRFGNSSINKFDSFKNFTVDENKIDKDIEFLKNNNIKYGNRFCNHYTI